MEGGDPKYIPLIREELDAGGEALILTFFADERPLRGAAGLCDFRLCGRISRLLASGKVGGAWGETTLYPPLAHGQAKLSFPQLLLFGRSRLLAHADGSSDRISMASGRVRDARQATADDPRSSDTRW